MLSSLFRDRKGEIDIGMIISAVIAVVIAGILVSSLLPAAINNVDLTQSGNSFYVGGVNVSQGTGDNAGVGNWTTGMRSTWSAIPIFAVLAGLLVFVAIIIKLSRD